MDLRPENQRDAMSAQTTLAAAFASSYQHELDALDRGARTALGITVTPLMHRTTDLIWNVIALASTVWFVAAGVEPIYALSFGALLIAGEKAIETYLIGIGIAEKEAFESGE